MKILGVIEKKYRTSHIDDDRPPHLYKPSNNACISLNFIKCPLSTIFAICFGFFSHCESF